MLHAVNDTQGVPRLAATTDSFTTTDEHRTDHNFFCERNDSSTMSVPALSRSNSMTSSPIAIPRCSPMSPTLSQQQQQQQLTRATETGPGKPKCLPSSQESTNILRRIFGAVFFELKAAAENDGETETFDFLPGIKQMI